MDVPETSLQNPDPFQQSVVKMQRQVEDYELSQNWPTSEFEPEKVNKMKEIIKEGDVNVEKFIEIINGGMNISDEDVGINQGYIQDLMAKNPSNRYDKIINVVRAVQEVQYKTFMSKHLGPKKQGNT